MGKPSFQEVAKDINLEGVRAEIHERVISDFKPFLEAHALDVLKKSFASHRSPDIPARIAYEYSADVLHIRAEMPAATTELRVLARRY